MITVGLSERDEISCANLNHSNWTMTCDLGSDCIVFRLIDVGYFIDSSYLSVPKTDNLLALRKAVFTNQANPALLADALEESQGSWFHCAFPQKIVDTLRTCWSETIRLHNEEIEPEVEYTEEVISES